MQSSIRWEWTDEDERDFIETRNHVRRNPHSMFKEMPETDRAEDEMMRAEMDAALEYYFRDEL